MTVKVRGQSHSPSFLSTGEAGDQSEAQGQCDKSLERRMLATCSICRQLLHIHLNCFIWKGRVEGFKCDLPLTAWWGHYMITVTMMMLLSQWPWDKWPVTRLWPTFIPSSDIPWSPRAHQARHNFLQKYLRHFDLEKMSHQVALCRCITRTSPWPSAVRS